MHIGRVICIKKKNYKKCTCILPMYYNNNILLKCFTNHLITFLRSHNK